jgi:FkbM family methyltransferase
MRIIKKLVYNFIYSLGYHILKNSEASRVQQLANSGARAHFLSESELTQQVPVREALRLVESSKSQLGQDILALSRVGLDRPGYFVEFGATDGVSLSNTYVLEKNYGWSGILCEPAVNWQSDLRANRNSVIDTRCVFSSSGDQLDFSESSTGELSTLRSFVHSDTNAPARVNLINYKVTTVTLADLLREHQAPNYIDFISIDTEGSEYLILRDFDFDEYRFGLMCIEHNYTENRDLIFKLLSSKGYKRIFEEFSMWDDWYVKES